MEEEEDVEEEGEVEEEWCENNQHSYIPAMTFCHTTSAYHQLDAARPDVMDDSESCTGQAVCKRGGVVWCASVGVRCSVQEGGGCRAVCKHGGVSRQVV